MEPNDINIPQNSPRALVASGISTGPNTLEPLSDSTETKAPDGGGRQEPQVR